MVHPSTALIRKQADCGRRRGVHQCAVNWPPLLTQGDPVLTEGVAGVIGSTLRKDGTVQATYNGWPLYYWINDHNPGETTGQNVGGVWFVVNP